MAVRVIKRHDRKVTPWARFLDEAGIPINLTGATVVFSLQNQQTGVLKITRAAAIIRDQGTYPGEALYQFSVEDVDTEGYYTEEWEITHSDGLKESFPVDVPVDVHIMADLDNL